MNGEPAQERTGLAYVIAILGSFLIVALLVWAMHRYTQPPPLGADRAEARARALAELRGAEADGGRLSMRVDLGLRTERQGADRRIHKKLGGHVDPRCVHGEARCGVVEFLP